MRSAAARAAGTAAVLAWCPFLLAASPTDDGRLVHMLNGRTVRAEAVESNGEWLMMTLRGGGVVGVPAAVVEEIEADLLPPDDGEETAPNVVTSGRHVPRSRRLGRSRTRPRRPPASAQSGRERSKAEGQAKSKPSKPADR